MLAAAWRYTNVVLVVPSHSRALARSLPAIQWLIVPSYSRFSLESDSFPQLNDLKVFKLHKRKSVTKLPNALAGIQAAAISQYRLNSRLFNIDQYTGNKFAAILAPLPYIDPCKATFSRNLPVIDVECFLSRTT